MLTLVIPTLNERDNVSRIHRRIAAALGEIDWEIVFVDDDSPDRTWEVAKQISHEDPRVRCIRRFGRSGLAGACIEGLSSSSAEFVAVMDADLQHDEAILPEMLARLETGGADLVVGSRYARNGTAGEGFSARRALLSRWAVGLAKLALRAELTDAMSGYFMMRRPVFDAVAPRLTPTGFKILADIVASLPAGTRIVEVGYGFRKRTAGTSKMAPHVGLDLLGLLLNKWSRGLIPVRFVLFSLTGLVGLAVHLAVLRLCLSETQGGRFALCQAVAAVSAMTCNFAVNNAVTYRDRRLRGMAAVRGLLTFYAVCGIGTLANVGVGSWVYAADRTWWLAGVVGAVVSAVSNYSLSTSFVWSRAR